MSCHVSRGNLADDNTSELTERYRALSRGKKIVLIVFTIWAVQAIPKWSLAIFSDGETSSQIMQMFIPPR